MAKIVLFFNSIARDHYGGRYYEQRLLMLAGLGLIGLGCNVT